jgi:hemerythrin
MHAMADTMRWSDKYLLGHAAMDSTHQEFVACVAALQMAADADLPQRMQEFAAHAVAHFQQEERWMGDSGFPAAQCHADEHAAVLKSVREVQALFEPPQPMALACDVARQLTQALVEWFPAHADHLDSALSQWLVKRSLGGAPVVLKRGAATATQAFRQG